VIPPIQMTSPVFATTLLHIAPESNH